MEPLEAPEGSLFPNREDLTTDPGPPEETFEPLEAPEGSLFPNWEDLTTDPAPQEETF